MLCYVCMYVCMKDRFLLLVCGTLVVRIQGDDISVVQTYQLDFED